MPGVRPWWAATVRSTSSRTAASGVSGVRRMSRRAWAERGMIVRRSIGEAPSVIRWLTFTVGRRYGVKTARPSHFANTAAASRRNAVCASA